MNDHDHSHDHSHGHSHSHDRHEHQAPVQDAAVVLEIGGDIGALIMYLDEELERTEISIEWEVDPSKDVHTGVWRRTAGTTNAVMAVYSELVEGRYFVPALNGHPAQSVDIRGGHVEEIDLRTR